MRDSGLYLVGVVAVLAVFGCGPAPEEIEAVTPSPTDRVRVSPNSDDRAIEIAQGVMERMGGWESWDSTRFLSWDFFGKRRHHWDRLTGDVRIEGPAGDHQYLWLLNVSTRQGRVWKDGNEITDTAELAETLDLGRQIWVNDSYWVVMPYKLLDPGVTLKDSGEGALQDGRAADVLEMTFGEGVGYTPENRYEVFVARDTGLVEQWSFYADASDDEPGFTLPWGEWRTFGAIMLATEHGQGEDWAIAVHETLPPSVFSDPEPTAY